MTLWYCRGSLTVSGSCHLTAFWSFLHTDSWQHESEWSPTVRAQGPTDVLIADIPFRLKRSCTNSQRARRLLGLQLFGVFGGNILNKTARFCSSGMSRTSLCGTGCKPTVHVDEIKGTRGAKSGEERDGKGLERGIGSMWLGVMDTSRFSVSLSSGHWICSLAA